MSDKSEGFLDTAARYLNELTSSGDYSTKTEKKDNKVKKSQIPTYKGEPDGTGAAQGVVDSLRARQKMLDEI